MSDATGALNALAADYNASDWDGFASRFSVDFTFADHRGEEVVELVGSRLFIGGAKQLARDGFTRFESAVIDSSGNNVVLARIRFIADSGDADERIAVYRFDQALQLARYDSYGLGDVETARELLDD